MYQYKARLTTSLEIIAQGHNVEDVEHQIKKFRRAQKRGEHTKMNIPVEIIHVFRDLKKGQGKEILLKIV